MTTIRNTPPPVYYNPETDEPGGSEIDKLLAASLATAGIGGAGYGTYRAAKALGYPGQGLDTQLLAGTYPGQALDAKLLARGRTAASALGAAARAPVSGASSLTSQLAQGAAMTGAQAMSGLKGLASKVKGPGTPLGWKGYAGRGLAATLLPVAGQIAGDAAGGGMLGDILSGAGTGAGIGTGVSMIPGVNIAAPLLIGGGALLGGIGGAIFGGGDEKDPMEDLQRLIGVGAVTGDDVEAAKLTYDGMKEILGEEQAKQLALGPLIEKVSMGASDTDLTPRALAQQMLASHFMQPYVNDMVATANAQQNAMQNLIADSTLPQSFRDAYQVAIPLEFGTQKRLANSTMLAAQVAPYIAALEEAQTTGTGGSTDILSELSSLGVGG